jgi:hypothetical protein
MFSDPRLWLDILQTLVIAVLWVRKTHDGALKNISDIGTRMLVVEKRIDHMPTATEVAKLEGTVRVVSAQITGLEDSVRVARSTVGRIETYLLESKK